jgi:hypothetical protein
MFLVLIFVLEADLGNIFSTKYVGCLDTELFSSEHYAAKWDVELMKKGTF